MAEDKRVVCPFSSDFCRGDKCALWDPGRLMQRGGLRSDGQCAFLSIARLTGLSYVE